jgi:hypothetical protein
MHKPKLCKNYKPNIETQHILGNWTERVDDIQKEFQFAKPFECVIIDDFLDLEFAEKLYDLFPNNFENWYHYENPLEVKYAYDDVNSLPGLLKDYFYHISSTHVLSLISKISGIEDLQCDEYLHGAGLHSHPRHGRLQIHLDYEKHPISGKERRLNLILFMSKDWNDEWNGHNEIWNKELSICERKTSVRFNRAILFKTNDISFHGLSEVIQCPEGTFRKSLAYYFVSPITDKKKTYRQKAKFYQTQTIPYNENFQKLCDIRSQRLITCEDLKELFPDWSKEKKIEKI